MNENQKRYFMVTAKCGHVGRKHYVPIAFPVAAACGKEAAAVARWYLRVKHHHPDAIIDCQEIDREQYDSLIEKNRLDPYLRCKCRRDQKMIPGFRSRLRSEKCSWPAHHAGKRFRFSFWKETQIRKSVAKEIREHPDDYLE